MKPPLRLAGMVVFGVVALVLGSTLLRRPCVFAAAPVAFPSTSGNAPFTETSWEKLSDQNLKTYGKAAMPNPKAWRHGETEHFIIHFQKLAEAQRAARDVEFYYQHLKKTFGLDHDYHKGKCRLFIFAKANDWATFLAALNKERFISVTHSGEMGVIAYANDEGFSRQLAFPVTCSVLYHYFPKLPPFWFQLGMAEFEIGNAYAKMKGIGGGERGSGRRGSSIYPLEDLLTATAFPSDRSEFARTSERLVRFLLGKLGPQKFVTLAIKLCEAEKFEEAILEVAPDKFKSYNDFKSAYAQFQ